MYVYVLIQCIKLTAYFLAPTLTANLSPPLIVGDTGEDPIKLLCTALVEEDIMLVNYQFTWIKDATPVDLSTDRIEVIITNYNCTAYLFKLCWIHYTMLYILFLYRLPIIIAHHHLPSKPLILMLQ